MAMYMTDVVIVGAGPIGLAFAWALKQLNPNLKIVIYEKYEQYQRKHTLNMLFQHLAALIKAADAENNPLLKELLQQLQKDPHIRTSELEKTFKAIVESQATDIIIKEITGDNIHEEILTQYPDAKLIFGADGTHSVVSKTLFGADNQEKHELDYVLQLRYEIQGEQKPEAIQTVNFYQMMARQGLIANEYIGNFADGRTPVTVQMMITKEAFKQLQAATSKNPIKLGDSQRLELLPDNVRSFLNQYLELKMMHCRENKEQVDFQSITVSVNEAPVTRAKKVTTTVTRGMQPEVIAHLGGDAQLGLSYFKGLNAGIEALAVLITFLKTAIQQGFTHPEEMQKGFTAYQQWFEIFARKKMNEVAQYSIANIHRPWTIMKAARNVKLSTSGIEDKPPLERLFRDFERFIITPSPQVRLETTRQLNVINKFFPHRAYDPISLGELRYTPVIHHLKKIAKIFVDYVKPYKSKRQVQQDFRQPFIGLLNGFIGTIKFVKGIKDPRYFIDGLFTLIRAGIELLTFPLTWTLKFITRSITTLVYHLKWGPKKIEDNKGLNNLGQLGLTTIEQLDKEMLANPPSAQKIYATLAICHDIHRKFIKNLKRAQPTNIKNEEKILYQQISDELVVQPQLVRQYCSLFYYRENEHPIGEQRDELLHPR